MGGCTVLNAIFQLQRVACLITGREWNVFEFVLRVLDMFTRFPIVQSSASPLNSVSTSPSALPIHINPATQEQLLKNRTHMLRFKHSTGIFAP